MSGITIAKNGPYLVSSAVPLKDAEGKEIKVEKKMYALCRCGQSANKPFCDGTHSNIGFEG